MVNIYQKYQISKSLNGDEVVYLARVGKQKKLIMRATSEKDLVDRMAAAAKEYNDKIEAQKKQKLEAEANQEAGGKKIGLWKPGKLVNKQTTAATSTKVEVQ